MTVCEATPRVGEELEAEGAQPGPRRGGARLVAGEDAVGALGRPSAGGPRRPGRRPRSPGSTASGRRRGSRGAPGGRGRSAASSPSPSPSSARGEAATMARPGADIQAFCEPVTTTSTPQASISNGTAPERRDAVDEDERVGRDLADGGGELGDRVHDRRRGLVVGQQDGLVVAGPARARSRTSSGRCGLAPLGLDLGDVRAVGPRRSWRTGRRTSRSTRRGPGRPATAC